MPRPEKRLHQRQDVSVFDSQTYPVHQGRVVDGVKAGLDIALDHPLIGVGGKHACLGDRVVSASIRA
jgi:hypothetical protein